MFSTAKEHNSVKKETHGRYGAATNSSKNVFRSTLSPEVTHHVRKKNIAITFNFSKRYPCILVFDSNLHTPTSLHRSIAEEIRSFLTLKAFVRYYNFMLKKKKDKGINTATDSKRKFNKGMKTRRKSDEEESDKHESYDERSELCYFVKYTRTNLPELYMYYQPLQENNFDCGVYCIQFVEKFMRNVLQADESLINECDALVCKEDSKQNALFDKRNLHMRGESECTLSLPLVSSASLPSNCVQSNTLFSTWIKPHYVKSKSAEVSVLSQQWIEDMKIRSVQVVLPGFSKGDIYRKRIQIEDLLISKSDFYSHMDGSVKPTMSNEYRKDRDYLPSSLLLPTIKRGSPIQERLMMILKLKLEEMMKVFQ
jgi:hypothetical protein